MNRNGSSQSSRRNSSNYSRYRGGGLTYSRLFSKSRRNVYPNTRSTGNRRNYRYVARTLGNPISATETKYYDAPAVHQLPFIVANWGTAGASPTSGSLCVPPQGTGSGERIGRSIKLRTIRFKGTLAYGNWAPGSALPYYPATRVRVLVVLDKQCNGTLAAGNDVLESGSSSLDVMFYAHQNTSTLGRFKILMDKHYVLQNPNFTSYNGSSVTNANSITVPIKFSWTPKVPLNIHFNSGTSAAVTNLVDHNIFVLAGASCWPFDATYGIPVDIQYRSRAYFMDP